MEKGFVPLWRPRVVKFARCARVPDVDRSLPEGWCEFVDAALVDAACEGRRCIDGSFCPKRCFGDPAVYVLCPTRLEKLKTKSKEKV